MPVILVHRADFCMNVVQNVGYLLGEEFGLWVLFGGDPKRGNEGFLISTFQNSGLSAFFQVDFAFCK